ncbi:transposase [Paenibacillus sp. B2(2019)]|uniref:transposase n=1 Tax=Paenibacillus sp. B2(2019) TaxID=2607754 RepID=UPI00292DC11B|nr:transposase [Paenibacillus sp. B2(2019)]
MNTSAFPKKLLLIDATTMTVGKMRLPWAPYHDERAGIKLHVALRAETVQPLNVMETIGSRHDRPVSEHLEHPDYIIVMDRAYEKLERLDRYKTDKQSFVIRLRDFEDREIRVVTDLMQVTPEQIAQIYKAH